MKRSLKKFNHISKSENIESSKNLRKEALEKAIAEPVFLDQLDKRLRYPSLQKQKILKDSELKRVLVERREKKRQGWLTPKEVSIDISTNIKTKEDEIEEERRIETRKNALTKAAQISENIEKYEKDLKQYLIDESRLWYSKQHVQDQNLLWLSVSERLNILSPISDAFDYKKD